MGAVCDLPEQPIKPNLRHLGEKLQTAPIILIFSTLMGYDHSLEVKTSQIHPMHFSHLMSI